MPESTTKKAIPEHSEVLHQVAHILGLPAEATLADIPRALQQRLHAHDDLCASLGRLFDCKATLGSSKRFLWQDVLSSRLWALLADAEARFRRVERQLGDAVTTGDPVHPADFSVVVTSKPFGEVVGVAVSKERPADHSFDETVPTAAAATPEDLADEHYERGWQAAGARMLSCVARILPTGELRRRAFLEQELHDARAALRRVCEHHGDLDWDDDLHLADVIEKHLEDHLESADVRSPETVQSPADYGDALALVEKLADEAHPEGVERCGLEKAARALRHHRLLPPMEPAGGS